MPWWYCSHNGFDASLKIQNASHSTCNSTLRWNPSLLLTLTVFESSRHKLRIHSVCCEHHRASFHLHLLPLSSVSPLVITYFSNTKTSSPPLSHLILVSRSCSQLPLHFSLSLSPFILPLPFVISFTALSLVPFPLLSFVAPFTHLVLNCVL